MRPETSVKPCVYINLMKYYLSGFLQQCNKITFIRGTKATYDLYLNYSIYYITGHQTIRIQEKIKQYKNPSTYRHRGFTNYALRFCNKLIACDYNYLIMIYPAFVLK